VWKWKPYVEFQYGGRLGEFNGMSSHSDVSHCKVLPLGEFTVTIPENSIRHIENRFSRYFIFLFLMQFRLWRAAAFVSSPIYLFDDMKHRAALRQPSLLSAVVNVHHVRGCDCLDRCLHYLFVPHNQQNLVSMIALLLLQPLDMQTWNLAGVYCS